MKNKKDLKLVICLFELQNKFKKLDFWSGPFGLGPGKKRKKQNIEFLRNEKCLLEEITIFHNF